MRDPQAREHGLERACGERRPVVDAERQRPGRGGADPLLRLLFLFTALEAILGDKAGGLKGPPLALGRALLGLATRDGFAHPARILVLYDKVRSFAVHGEEAPPVPERELNSVAWDVRRALNEFLEFARREKLTKRKHVRDALDADPRRENVIAGLLRDQPDLWAPYLEPPSK